MVLVEGRKCLLFIEDDDDRVCGAERERKTLNKRLTVRMAASEKTVPLNPVSIPKIPLICAFTASWSNCSQK